MAFTQDDINILLRNVQNRKSSAKAKCGSKAKVKSEKEDSVHAKIAKYIRLKYPKIIFRTDFSAGIKMSIRQAVKHKLLQSGRAYPDLFIAEPKFSNTTDTLIKITCGLFIELKREGTVIYKKDGGIRANEHLREQDDMLEALRAKGYVAEFAIGFEEAKNIIDNYLLNTGINIEIKES